MAIDQKKTVFEKPQSVDELPDIPAIKLKDPEDEKAVNDALSRWWMDTRRVLKRMNDELKKP